MLVITPTAEIRLTEVFDFLRELDNYQLALDRDAGLEPSVLTYELMLFRELDKLRRYHLLSDGHAATHDGAVTMHPAEAYPSLNFSLIWARKETGPHMQGMLYWDGPDLRSNPSVVLRPGRVGRWSWSTHT